MYMIVNVKCLLHEPVMLNLRSGAPKERLPWVEGEYLLSAGDEKSPA